MVEIDEEMLDNELYETFRDVQRIFQELNKEFLDREISIDTVTDFRDNIKLLELELGLILSMIELYKTMQGEI